MPHLIPRSDPVYDEWLRNFVDYCAAHAGELGLLPDDVVAIQDAYNKWQIAYAEQQTAKNAAKAATESKEEARNESEGIIRRYTKIIQSRPDTTDAQREELGITVPDRIRTPLSRNIVLTEPPPKVEARCTAPKQVTINWYPTPVDTESRALPPGIDGVAIWYAEGRKPATNQWKFLALDTNSPYVHNVGNAETVTLSYKAVVRPAKKNGTLWQLCYRGSDGIRKRDEG